MKLIRSRKDVEEFLNRFKNVARYDELGKKHYFVFDDNKRGGQWTLMHYENGSYSIHGKGKTYCDEEECYLSTVELTKLLWNNRKALNSTLRILNKEKTLI